MDETKSKNESNINDVKQPFQAVRTPRSVYLANEARKNKMMPYIKRNEIFSFIELNPFLPNTIIEIQEKERLATLRKRETESMKLNMLQKINLMLKNVNNVNQFLKTKINF